MTKFNFIRTRKIWESFVLNPYVQLKFNQFLVTAQDDVGHYYNDLGTLESTYRTFKFNNFENQYSSEFVMILHQIGIIIENPQFQEAYIDSSILSIKSHNDIIEIVSKDIEVKDFIRTVKLKRIKNKIKVNGIS